MRYVFAYPAAVDLRKGYDGLFGLVETGLKRDPLSGGELFLFVNQSHKLCNARGGAVGFKLQTPKRVHDLKTTYISRCIRAHHHAILTWSIDNEGSSCFPVPSPHAKPKYQARVIKSLSRYCYVALGQFIPTHANKRPPTTVYRNVPVVDDFKPSQLCDRVPAIVAA